MEEYDQDLVQKLFDANAHFRLLYEEHLFLERELNAIGEKGYLSPEEELEKRKMQKLKLAGKDEMDRILRNHRQ